MKLLNSKSYEALRTFVLYSHFMKDALFLKAQAIIPGSILN